MENSIKVGYDSKTNLYTFKSPSSHLAKNLCVNGKPIADPLLGQKVGELMTINERPDTITYETSERKLAGYTNTEICLTISVDDYKKVIDTIDKTRKFDDDDDDDDYYAYDSIEDEVFAIRFFRTHTALYQNIQSVHTMEIEFISYPVSEYSNIVPLYSIDAKNIFETNCKFTPNNTKLFYELCKRRGVDSTRITLPTHSGLRYVKIDNQYVSGLEDFQKTADREIIASYTECVNRMDLLRTNLSELISFHFAKHSQNTMDKTTIGALLTQLQILQNSVYGLEVKVKDVNLKRAIQNRINELINVYKELA